MPLIANEVVFGYRFLYAISASLHETTGVPIGTLTLDPNFSPPPARESIEYKGPTGHLYSTRSLLEAAVASLSSPPDYKLCITVSMYDVAKPWVGQQVTDILALTDQNDFGSSFLGYDVCDCGFLSALWNMGYAYDEGAVMKDVNEYGLFDSWQAADLFATASSELAPEHAPFWALGLYQLPELL